METNDLGIGESVILKSKKIPREKEKELERAIAAITEKEYRGSKQFVIRSGQEVDVINGDGRMNEFIVFKILAGLVILAPKEKRPKDVGLLERLYLAYEIITKKFFQKA